MMDSEKPSSARMRVRVRRRHLDLGGEGQEASSAVMHLLQTLLRRPLNGYSEQAEPAMAGASAEALRTTRRPMHSDRRTDKFHGLRGPGFTVTVAMKSVLAWFENFRPAVFLSRCARCCLPALSSDQPG